MSDMAPQVGIVMGSDSDWPVMEAASIALSEFGIPHEVDVVSAHRMPEDMIAYGLGAAERGLRVIIAGAGGAAHLPGMLASVTALPILGAAGTPEAAELQTRLDDFRQSLGDVARDKGAALRARRAGTTLP